MSNNLPQAIEAILFATAAPQTFATLAMQLETDTESIARAVEELKTMMEGHGIAITELNHVVSLTTRSEHTPTIEAIRKDELSKDLSRASAETLAVITYTPGVSKSQIEFIRGVNVSYSIRALMMRGLIETKGSGRVLTYYPTLQLLEYFGVSSIEGLPDYAATKHTIDALMKGAETETNPAQL